MTRTEAFYAEASPKRDFSDDLASPSPIPPTRNLRQMNTPRMSSMNDSSSFRGPTPRSLSYQPPKAGPFQGDQTNGYRPYTNGTPNYEVGNNYSFPQNANAKIGGGVIGPPMMFRVALSLKSGLPAEIDWALHHLVRMSFQEADSLRLDLFPGLAEALLSKLASAREVIDVALSKPTTDGDSFANLDGRAFRDSFDKILEAALALRNASLQSDNARYLARLGYSRDIIVSGIDVPDHQVFIELRQYCYDIAETMSPYLGMDGLQDRLYTVLRNSLESSDRGVLVASLRALARLVIGDDKNKLQDLSADVLEKIQLYLLLDDEELVSACLDVLYQFTRLMENVERLIASSKFSGLIHQLVRLMMYQAQPFEERRRVHSAPKPPHSQPSHPPPLPPEVLQELLSYTEPDRALRWLKVCFAEDDDADVTQISLWQAYQARFNEYIPQGRPLLQAADLIKNVSQAFPRASAMVQTTANGQRFIIKGIKPRVTPVSVKGVEYMACKWQDLVDQEGRCPSLFSSGQDLFLHIIDYHLEKGDASIQCHWAGCSALKNHQADLKKAVAHIRTHIPKSASDVQHNLYPDSPENSIYLSNLMTAVDEHGDAAGLALTAALVLRNLCAAEEPRRILHVHEEHLIRVAAINHPLAPYIADLLAPTL